MTERRPPTLGTFRPTQDGGPKPQDAKTRRPRPSPGLTPYPGHHAGAYPEPEPMLDSGDHQHDTEHLPRIITARVRDDQGQPIDDRVPPTRPRTKRRRPPPPPPPPPEGMGWLKIFGFSLLGLAAFVVAAAVAAFMLVPTDLIRSRLEAEVKLRTGRDLQIGGKTALSLWPRPAVSVGDVTLSAPAAMGAGPLLKVAEIDIAIQILPLLLHDVAIDRLVLRKPVIDLRVDGQGRKSWEFADAGAPAWPQQPVRLAQAPTGGSSKALPKELQDFMRGATDGQATERPSGTAASGSKSRISDLTLGNVEIADGSVRYRDERSGLDETVTALNTTMTLANIASPLEAKGDFVWRGESTRVEAQLSPFRALLDGRPIQAQVKATAAPLSLSFDGFALLGNELELDGRVNAAAPALERLARWTGRPVPGSLAGGFSIDGKVKQAGGTLSLTDARLGMGPLNGRGSISVDGRGVRPFVKGAIQLASLDFNALQALAEGAAVNAAPSPNGSAAPQAIKPAAGVPQPKSIEDLLETAPAAPATGTQRKPQVRGYTKRDGWSDDAFDLAALGLVDAELRVAFDKVVWREMATGPGQMQLGLKAKVARLTLEDVQLFNGRARGIVTVDGTGAEALVGGNVVADGVSMLPFLTAVSGFDWLSGRGRVSLAVAGRGATERQIVSTLNGKADIAVADGAVAGINFAGIVRSMLQGRTPVLERSPTEKTEFSEFAASVLITNGVARNDDLRLISPQVRATGAGSIDLPARTMDYVLKPKVAPGQGGGATAGLEIPLKINGSIDKPTVTPDVGGLLRDPNQAVQAIQEAAKTPAGKEVQETVKGLLNGDPNARAKAKGFLDQLLKK